MPATTLLNNYDMVLAISQNTINNQFYLLLAEDVISSTINIQYIPNNPKLILNATVSAPTVNMVLSSPNPNQVQFNVNLASGSFTYMDYGKDPNNPQSADVSGWVLTFLVNLELLTLDSSQQLTTGTPDSAGLVISQSAQDALSPYVGDAAFTVQALFLDLDNVNLSQLVITADGINMSPSDPRYPWLLTAMQQLVSGLKTSGNPYILSFHASSNNPPQTNPQLPALAPTRIQYIANQYSYPAGSRTSGGDDDGLSSLCYLAMVQNDPFPYPDGKVPAFVWNQIPSAQVQGRMFIDSNIFSAGYVHALVLPVLQDALNVGTATGWSQTGNTWTLDWKWDNGNQNDGHGPVVGSDSGILDIYGKTSMETYCTIALDLPNSTSNRLQYSGSGYFFEQLDLYEYPFDIWAHDAWTNTRLPFTFTLVLSAGANGTITAVFTPTEGSSSQDQWENPVVSITDAVASLFTTSLSSQLTNLSQSWSAFQQSEFSAFTSSAQNGFTALSQQLILPAPQQFYYSNIGLNTENDIVLDIGFKS